MSPNCKGDKVLTIEMGRRPSALPIACPDGLKLQEGREFSSFVFLCGTVH